MVIFIAAIASRRSRLSLNPLKVAPDAAIDALEAAPEMPPPLDPGTVIFGVIGAVIVGAVVLPRTPEMLLNVPGVDVIPLTDGISAPGFIRLTPLMIALTASIAKLRIGLMTARTLAN